MKIQWETEFPWNRYASTIQVIVHSSEVIWDTEIQN